MDKDLYYISLFLMFLGIGGQLTYYFFALHGGTAGAPTQASFQEIENITGYALIIGLILLPAGLFKDGLPAPGHTARVLIGVILVVSVGVAFTGILVAPTSQSAGPKPDAFLQILPGSATPGTAITFSPKNATVYLSGPNQNNTVQWTNNDSATHTVTFRSAPSGVTLYNSGLINPGGKVVFQFTVPGTYVYYCTLHPGWMQATIIVKSG